MQNNTSLSLDGLGTLFQVLSEEKKLQLKEDLQQVVDRWHRQEMSAIVNAALLAIQQQQAMKAMQNNSTEQTTDIQEVK
jgi:hypothetical protein